MHQTTDGGPLVAVRTGLVELIRDALRPDDDGLVEAHPRATFTAADLSRALCNRSLAVRVAFVGVPVDAEWSASEVDAETAWAVYIATRDDANVPRDVRALGVIPDLLLACADPELCPEICNRRKVEALRVGSLYDGDLDGKSAMIWSITFRMKLALSPCPPDDLRALVNLTTRFDLVPTDDVIEAEDEISMVSP